MGISASDISRRLKAGLSLGLFSLCLLCACKGKGGTTGQKPADTQEETTVEWAETTWDFGQVSNGESVAHTFRFTNTGQHHLLIRKIETGCGCSTASYDKAPIAPGEKGKIEIVFNSAGRYGKQYKEIRIFANIPVKQSNLKFTADIRN